jgi:hypothetical protein
VGAQAEAAAYAEEEAASDDFVGVVGSSVGHMASAAVETTQLLINKVPLLGGCIPIGARPAAGGGGGGEGVPDARPAAWAQRASTCCGGTSGSGGRSSTSR